MKYKEEKWGRADDGELCKRNGDYSRYLLFQEGRARNDLRELWKVFACRIGSETKKASNRGQRMWSGSWRECSWAASGCGLFFDIERRGKKETWEFP